MFVLNKLINYIHAICNSKHTINYECVGISKSVIYGDIFITWTGSHDVYSYGCTGGDTSSCYKITIEYYTILNDCSLRIVDTYKNNKFVSMSMKSDLIIDFKPRLPNIRKKEAEPLSNPG
jgi:hypothetical protein